MNKGKEDIDKMKSKKQILREDSQKKCDLKKGSWSLGRNMTKKMKSSCDRVSESDIAKISYY